MRGSVVVALLVLALGALVAEAVDRSKFKTCEQSTFCRRHRRLSKPPSPEEAKPAQPEATADGSAGATEAPAPAHDHEPSDFVASPESIHVSATSFTIELEALHGDSHQVLTLEVTGLDSGVVRARLREKGARHTRYEVKDSLVPFANAKVLYKPKKRTIAVGKSTLALQFDPFRLDFFNERNEHVLVLNQRNLLNWEFFRSKPDGLVQANDIDGEWDENFQSHVDRKPRGPSSVGMDVTFLGVQHVYGIPEHATNVSLPATRGPHGARYEDPYRMYNLDVFEYEIDNPMALYGHVPFMIGHNAKHTTGVFWLNAAETWIDVDKSSVANAVSTHWISESGIIDVFLLPGPSARAVLQQYAQLTGATALPARFAIGYHQCKWNYRSEAEVTEINDNFEKHAIPYDVLWLDIEHTNGKRYMTWDATHFPTPKRMVDEVAAKGRRMVTIVDPHLKRDSDYSVHTSAQSGKHYIKDRDNNEYDGWCWPGSSSWPDFLSPIVRNWWAALFRYNVYSGSTSSLYTWNDMNEPSVFNGPEVTMHKDAIHLDGSEHRDVHNLYGMMFHAATVQGQIERNDDKNLRAFVLSRALFAGTQRFGAIWTGDNTADWSHLRASQPMLLSLGLAGVAFSGADVGGFFGNPDGELLTRWYQAAALQPFFRGHAHLDSKRREPWVYEEPYAGIMRDAIRLRYRLLPHLYTLFHEASVEGVPVMRPMWFEFPQDESTFAMDDQFMTGSALLVAPVVAQGARHVAVYLPEAGAPWYHYHTLAAVGNATPNIVADAPLERIPIFVRGGAVVVRQDRLRRSSRQMASDPFTIVVALNASGAAAGQLYWDDGETFDYQRADGTSALRSLRFAGNVLHNTAAAAKAKPWAGFGNDVERIVVAGVQKTPVRVLAPGARALGWSFDAELRVLTVRRPLLKMADDWSVTIEQ